MNTKFILSVVIVLAVVIGAVFIFSQSPPGGQVACTMEAKICPDGSTVGRSGPNCEFSACLDMESAGEKHYADPNGEFTLDYNPSFSLVPGDKKIVPDWRNNGQEGGILLVKVTAERTFFPGTNFSEATLSIGRSNSIASGCEVADASTGEVKAGPATVSGFPFTKFTSGDAGAGNFYDTTSYRGLIDGDCYSLEYTIHSTNIGNYPPEQGIKEFDKAKITDEMEKIVRSYRSLINSD